MPKYRVRKGKTFGAQSQYGEGEIVEFPENIGDAFADKLELVEDEETQAEETPSESSETTEPEQVIAKPKRKKKAAE